MRRAVIIFRINRGGKAGWQTSRAIMHLIMAGSSTSSDYAVFRGKWSAWLVLDTEGSRGGYEREAFLGDHFVPSVAMTLK